MVSKIFHPHTLHTQWPIPGMLAGLEEIQTTFQQELAVSVPLQLLLATAGYADKDNRILRQKEERLYNIASLPSSFSSKHTYNPACCYVCMKSQNFSLFLLTLANYILSSACYLSFASLAFIASKIACSVPVSLCFFKYSFIALLPILSTVCPVATA